MLSPLVAKLVDWAGSYRLVWIWMAANCFVGAIAVGLVMRMDRRTRAQADRVSAAVTGE